MPTALINKANRELVFDFQATGAGPLISIQQPHAGSADRPLLTEPLAYISPGGAIVIRARPRGLCSVALAGRRADGVWHQVSFGRDEGDWAISVDGVEQGHLGGFMTVGSSSRFSSWGRR